MYPILFHIGPITISSLGFFMTLAFLAASFLIWREAKREYLDEETVLDVFLLSVAFGIVGARISFIFLYPERFGINILRWMLPSWMPGFYLYGGIIVGFVVAFILSGYRKLGFTKFLDAIIPGVMFGAALYKIGQFLDGSLVGVAAKTIIGLPVIGESGRFIPISLIQAALYLLTFAFLVKVKDYFLVKRKIYGALFLVGVSLTSIIESASFFFTRDKIYISSIPVSLAFALFAFVASTALLYKKTRSLKRDLKSFKSKLPKKAAIS